jgi:hypothetical protein
MPNVDQIGRSNDLSGQSQPDTIRSNGSPVDGAPELSATPSLPRLPKRPDTDSQQIR